MNASATEPAGSSDDHRLPAWWRIAVWMISASWALLQLPYGYNVQGYVFFDNGWALTTDALLSEGLIPTRDFTFFYGLLTLVLDRMWFSIFGATPAAQAILCLLCTAASTHATIRYARAVRLRGPALWLLLVSAPLAIMPGFFPTPTHALEHALLINGIALQAAGHPAISLVLATICLFVKPTLAGLYGPILLGVILFGPRAVRTSWAARLIKLLPATIVGIAIAGMLAARFGIEPLIATLIPMDGAKLYAAENYGFFFGTGRRFWLPERIVWWYYPFTPAGFWLVGTIAMLIGAVRTIHLARGPANAAILTCIALHLAFIFFLFGNDMSWKYYPYLLVFGLCGVLNSMPVSGSDGKRWLPRVLISLAVLAQSYMLLICFAMLLGGLLSPVPRRSEATAGLMATAKDQESWKRIREIAARERVLVFSPVSAAHVLMPEVESPHSWFLLRPIAKPAEIERLRDQLRAADWLVIPKGPGVGLNTWPEFAEELGKFLLMEEHDSLVLVKRVEPAKP